MRLLGWEACNHTELYQACRQAGLGALPTDPKPKLIAMLEGVGGEPITHPLDLWRDAIMAFVIDYWPKLQSQVTCPAKTRDPKACYGCIDQQVVACLTKNGPLESYIQLRKKT